MMKPAELALCVPGCWLACQWLLYTISTFWGCVYLGHQLLKMAHSVERVIQNVMPLWGGKALVQSVRTERYQLTYDCKFNGAGTEKVTFYAREEKRGAELGTMWFDLTGPPVVFQVTLIVNAQCMMQYPQVYIHTYYCTSIHNLSDNAPSCRQRDRHVLHCTYTNSIYRVDQVVETEFASVMVKYMSRYIQKQKLPMMLQSLCYFHV